MGAQATIHRLKEYFHNAQAALDAASLIVSAKRLGEPDSNRALLDLPPATAGSNPNRVNG